MFFGGLGEAGVYWECDKTSCCESKGDVEDAFGVNFNFVCDLNIEKHDFVMALHKYDVVSRET